MQKGCKPMVISGIMYNQRKEDDTGMKKVCIFIALFMTSLFCACGGSSEDLQQMQESAGETATPGPYVVHISSSEVAETEAPASTGGDWDDVQASTEIDWEEVLALSEEYLPDVEALSAALSEPVTILDYYQGDIGTDGVEDMAVVYEYPETEGNPLMFRAVAIFTDKEGYQCIAFNDEMILDSMSGGTFGDPYQDINIADNGELHISLYGGSSWRWGYDLWFELVDGELLLHRLVNLYAYAFSGDLVLVNYNFWEQSTSCDAYWYEESENYALLYEYPWPEEIPMPAFAEITADGYYWGDSIIPDLEVPLPIADTFYANEENRGRYKEFSTEEILDAVKEETYPEMEKVMYDTDVIDLDAVSAFLGYKMPAYYYENTEGTQLYYFTATYDEDMGWKHEICVNGKDVYDILIHIE